MGCLDNRTRCLGFWKGLLLKESTSSLFPLGEEVKGGHTLISANLSFVMWHQKNLLSFICESHHFLITPLCTGIVFWLSIAQTQEFKTPIIYLPRILLFELGSAEIAYPEWHDICLGTLPTSGRPTYKVASQGCQVGDGCQQRDPWGLSVALILLHMGFLWLLKLPHCMAAGFQ